MRDGANGTRLRLKKRGWGVRRYWGKEGTSVDGEYNEDEMEYIQRATRVRRSRRKEKKEKEKVERG